MTADLAVVIPYHHRRDLLAKAVAAVAGHRIMVVDDSPGGDLPRGAYEVVRTSGEEGFARAANRGLAAAGTGRVLLLNDDAVPQPGCIDALLAVWHFDVGAAAPILEGPGGVESAGMIVRRWGRVRQLRRVPEQPTEVDAVSGACLLLSGDARFDPRFRHGFEDFELCRRLRRAGRRVLIVPAARCRHEGGATLSRAGREAQRHAVAGHLRFVGGGWHSPIVLGLAAAQVVREGGPWERLAGIVDGWRDWRRG